MRTTLPSCLLLGLLLASSAHCGWQKGGDGLTAAQTAVLALLSVNGTGEVESSAGFSVPASQILRMGDNAQTLLGASNDGRQVDELAGRECFVAGGVEFCNNRIDYDNAYFTGSYFGGSNFTGLFLSGTANFPGGATMAPGQELVTEVIKFEQVVSPGAATAGEFYLYQDSTSDDLTGRGDTTTTAIATN